MLGEPFFKKKKIKNEVAEWIQGIQIKCKEVNLKELQNFDLFATA